MIALIILGKRENHLLTNQTFTINVRLQGGHLLKNITHVRQSFIHLTEISMLQNGRTLSFLFSHTYL